MLQSIDLIIKEEDGQLQLSSPEVGYFSCSAPMGALLSPGQTAGVLRKLGQSFELTVPAGATGRVVNQQPDLINAPVGFGTLLYTLAPLSDEAPADGTESHADEGALGAPSFRSPHSGRFWHRPSPSDPAFIEVGSQIKAGDPIGLIEVMKTFTHLSYEPGKSLPQEATVTRILVQDGDEVNEGEVLIEIKALGN